MDTTSPPRISVTRLRLRRWYFLPAFFLQNAFVFRQIRRMPGLLSARIVREGHLGFWTVTLWKDEKATCEFRNSGAHLIAMIKLPRWCDEASVVMSQQDSGTSLSWAEIFELMKTKGRLTPVLHPSKSQRDGNTTPTEFKPWAELIIKKAATV